MLKAALAPVRLQLLVHHRSGRPERRQPGAVRRADDLRQPRRRSRPSRRRRCSTSWPAARAFCRFTRRRSASRTREPYIALVGAQFQRHGTGEFTTTFVNTTHPVMAGLQPFQVWDETYVHTKHNPADRTVLMERVDAAGREPWTWVRTHGKGRVFYTAYGHDERVWNNPNFHQLIKNAHHSGPSVRRSRRSSAALNIQPLRYTDGIVPIPNYERRDAGAEAAGSRSRPPRRPSTSRFRPASSCSCSRPSRSSPAIPRRWPGTSAAGSGLPRRRTIRTTCSRAGQGNDVIKILEDTNRDGRADKVDHLRRQAQHRRAASSSPTAASSSSQAGEFIVPEGHQRRRQGRRARVADDRLGHARHARARVEPQVRPRQLDLGRGRLLGLQRHGRRQAADLQSGALSLLAATASRWSTWRTSRTTRGGSPSTRPSTCSARPPTASTASTSRSRCPTTRA